MTPATDPPLDPHPDPDTDTDTDTDPTAREPAGGAGPGRPRVSWALVGLGAGAAALGVAQLVAGVVGPASAPVVAVGAAFVDLTPGWLKEAAISAFGTHDKQVLLSGAALVVAVLCALAGLLARARTRLALALVLVLGAVAAAAAASRPAAPAAAVLPSVVGALAGAGGLVLAARRGRAAPPVDVPPVDVPPVDVRPGGGAEPGGSARDPGRRDLLVAGAGLAAAGGAAALGGTWLGRSLHGADTSRAAVLLPAPAVAAAPLAAGDVGVPGVPPFRVPNADFYRIDTALLAPRVRSEDWSLRLHGMVDREVRLDYAELLRSPLVEHDATLICVSNDVGGELIGNARWLGLPLADLLRRAGPHSDADMVLSTSADGWTCSTPLEVLLDGRMALLAVGMNGAPLPVEHGFPVRMVVPGLYGFVSATKWVVDLEVTRFDRVTAYWTTRGWADRAPVKTSSRIDVPRHRATVRAGRVAVAGVAWAQHRGIQAVQVRVDDGQWQQARLAAVPGPDTWRQWVLDWEATPGSHQLQVRATDGTGTVQTGKETPVKPDGATGWHTISVEVT